MKTPSLLAVSLSLMLSLVSLTGNAEPAPDVPVITLSELVKNAEQFAGKAVTVTGRFGGMCADGADFYFKDKLDIIEVIPPAEGVPEDVVIGTPLKVQGMVVVRSEHEEEGSEENHDEGGAPEPEIKVRARVITVDRH